MWYDFVNKTLRYFFLESSFSYDGGELNHTQASPDAEEEEAPKSAQNEAPAPQEVVDVMKLAVVQYFF